MDHLARDFVGYGGNPPNPNWPGKARLALNFVLNFEDVIQVAVISLEPLTFENCSKRQVRTSGCGESLCNSFNAACIAFAEDGSRHLQPQARFWLLATLPLALRLLRNNCCCICTGGAR